MEDRPELSREEAVIEAALTLFGANGYKKASVADIAQAAGVSKSMVFHYFGNKKELYLHLADMCLHVIRSEVATKFDPSETDFFARIRLAAGIKITAMKRHPAILLFLGSIYKETDAQVQSDIKQRISSPSAVDFSLIFSGMDSSKFKEGIDPKLVMNILSRFTEGYLNSVQVKSGQDIDVLMKEFDQSLELMKKHFYREDQL